MRANSSDPQDTVTATQPIKAERLRLLDRISKYRQPIGLAVTLLLFAIALIACRHLLSELDLYALHDSILEVPKPALLGALGATVVGFIILLGYEWSASRYAGVTLAPRILALGGFTAFAIGNAIGLSMLSGGSVRYRLYARHGLGASEVAHMTLFASLSLGCALPPLAALATLSNLPAASAALGLVRDVAGRDCRGRAAAVHGTGHRHLPPSPAGTALPGQPAGQGRPPHLAPAGPSPDVPATDHHRPGRGRRRDRALSVAAGSAALRRVPAGVPAGPGRRRAQPCAGRCRGVRSDFAGRLLRHTRCRATGCRPAALSPDLRGAAVAGGLRTPADQRRPAPVSDRASPCVPRPAWPRRFWRCWCSCPAWCCCSPA